LRVWRPILTPGPVICVYTIVGVIFVILGIILFVTWADTGQTRSVRYDDRCHLNDTCVVNIHVKEKLLKPVYFYYEIHNHFQNYRKYLKSRSDFQLRGSGYTYADVTSCDPDISPVSTDILDTSANIPEAQIYLPCGLVPANFFNDTFFLTSRNGSRIAWDNKGIAWSEEVHGKFHQPPSKVKGIRVIENFKDPDFIVWMRFATFSEYIKLYRVIRHDIEPGIYQVHINNSWPTKQWDGSKYVLLATASWIGGKNLGISVAFIIVGGLSLLLALLFALKQLILPRKLGDNSYYHWFK